MIKEKNLFKAQSPASLSTVAASDRSDRDESCSDRETVRERVLSESQGGFQKNKNTFSIEFPYYFL